MGHGPAVKLGKDNASPYKAALGVKMFFAYTFVYAVFVALNSLSPATMEITFGGINLAVIYGVGLIVLALIMAVIYNIACCKAEARLNK